MSRPYASLMTWCALALASSLMLYHTSDRMHALNQHLRELEAQIDGEKQSLHVLNAEWVYLANPGRLVSAAQRHLPLAPTATARVVTMNDLGTLLPVQGDGAPAAVADAAAPSTGHVSPPAPAAAGLAGPLAAHNLRLHGSAHTVAAAEIPGFSGVLSGLGLHR